MWLEGLTDLNFFKDYDNIITIKNAKNFFIVYEPILDFKKFFLKVQIYNKKSNNGAIPIIKKELPP